MQTIVEPKPHIDMLWGKQTVKENQIYRLMRYVLRVDHDGKVLLHNVVTGRLVVLDKAEMGVIEKLPTSYSTEMEQLVTEHYLVPEDYNEHQQVINLQTVLRRLENAKRYPGITTFTILTTTVCNARCYYCYEQGGRLVTMSEQTANNVVDFIVEHCGPARKVFLIWFGGEPTLAANRITQICSGLKDKEIQYQSIMITNGYCFDRKMISEAKNAWNLKFTQICVDGIEENYNRIKAYAGVVDNPYQRVMNNIQLLLDSHIKVTVRMNFDKRNYGDFKPLLEELKRRLHDHSLLRVSAHPIIGEYPDHDGIVLHGSDEWFEQTMLEFDDILEEANVATNTFKLPTLAYKECMAASDYATTITPDGYLVRCPEQYGEDQITGTLREGITAPKLIEKWKEIAEIDKCKNCVFFPSCILMVHCLTSSKCIYITRRVKKSSAEAVRQWQLQTSKEINGGGLL